METARVCPAEPVGWVWGWVMPFQEEECGPRGEARGREGSVRPGSQKQVSSDLLRSRGANQVGQRFLSAFYFFTEDLRLPQPASPLMEELSVGLPHREGWVSTTFPVVEKEREEPVLSTYCIRGSVLSLDQSHHGGNL